MSNEPTRQATTNMEPTVLSGRLASLRLYWSRLTYSQKFTLISLIFTVPLLAFLPLIAGQVNRINNYGSREVQGNTYVNALWFIKSDLYELKLASDDFQNGTLPESSVNDLQKKIDTDFSALQAVHTNYRFSLSINNASLENLKTQWADLSKAVDEGRQEDIDRLFSELIASIDKLKAVVGNNSFLALDPDLDTYYMMDNVLNKLPESQELQFQILKIAEQGISDRALTQEQKYELNGLITRLEVNLNAVTRNAQTAMQNDSSGVMRSLVTPPLQSYEVAGDEFITKIKRDVLNSERTQLSLVDLRTSYQDVFQTGKSLFVVTSQTLELGIQARARSLTLNLFGSLFFGIAGVIIAFLVGSRTIQAISMPLENLISATEKLAEGKYTTRIENTGEDEIGRMAKAFNRMAQEIESNRSELDTYTQALERRSLELETIARVAREISIIRDLDTLLNVSVNLIRERFKYYHVGIFLIDDLNEYAILRAASSVAAQQMLDANYKLKVGETGLVGNVTRTGQAYIALDAGRDAVHFQNPFLPDTRSEIALPLRSRSTTIGALDIQATMPSAFDENDAKTLQLLADQLAAAIENAQLAQQVEGVLNELNNTYRTQTQMAWQSVIRQQKNASFEYDGLQIKAVPQHLPTDMLKQLESGKPIILKDTISHEHEHSNLEIQNTLMIPLMVFNQLIGVIGLEQADPDHAWTEEEITIAQAAANRAAITLENARLLNDSQRLASKERTISEAATRISSAMNLENILHITVEEIDRVLGGSEVTIQIHGQEKE